MTSRTRADLDDAAGVHDGNAVGDLDRDAEMSCVTKIIDSPSSRCSSRSSSRICTCTVASSAVVGSSASRMRGWLDSASAIMARWRMPPDISCG